MVFGNSKGQSAASAGGAAFLILIITILIVFYVLFLPPADRAALLDSGSVPGTAPRVSGGFSHLVNTVPFSEHVGTISYVSEATIQRDLPSFTIFTQTDARVLASTPTVDIKRSAYETRNYELPFAVVSGTTDNLQLSFNVLRGSGDLQIFFNGERIHNAPLRPGSPQPIPLPSHLVKQNNVLFFSVSSPGFLFWTMNHYELSGVQVVGDITDNTNDQHIQSLFFSASEVEHAEQVMLRFLPDCSREQIARLEVRFNGYDIFRGIPDCNLLNFVPIDTSLLQEGSNRLSFSSQGGNYLIDRVRLDVDLKDPAYPIYYFDLDEDLFVTRVLEQRYCGQVDGYCPDGCSGYEDKDCCFASSPHNYWCAIPTDNPRDRCVNQVTRGNLHVCRSGYEDRHGNPHPLGEGLCGDNTDGFCPVGCTAEQDRDCCFAASSSNYWCDDLPTTGLVNRCTSVVTASQCGACPNGYYQEDGSAPNCPVVQQTNPQEKRLKSGVDIILEAYFSSQDFNQVDFLINAQPIRIDTRNSQIFRNINSLVHQGMNSLEIRPRRDVSFSQVRVVIE